MNAAPLSILHISTWDNVGGSGRAAYRLHTGMKRLGLTSRMLVGGKKTTDPDVRVLGGCLSPIDRGIGRLVDQMDLQYLFYPSSLFLPWMRWVREADVIQVFNTHGGYLSLWGLANLSSTKPVVWRLSDMWAFTGHCSYSYECERWKTGCGQCPHLAEYPRLKRDTSAFLWRYKQKIYQRSHLNIVAPSRWMERLAGESPLLNRFPIHWIPNGLDTEVFRPLPKLEARRKIGLPEDGFVLMFSASSVREERKGAYLLQGAIEKLPQHLKEAITLLIVGEEADHLKMNGFRIKSVNAVSEDPFLAELYSSSDLFIVPTLADNLPNTVLESMACGTPVVSFDVGGLSDAVGHMESGYLARFQDADDLKHGIELLLTDQQLRQTMGQASRKKAEKDYSLDVQARRFEQLYREILQKQSARK